MNNERKSMGLEKKISRMNPKLKQLYLNIISILMIVSIVYGALTFFVSYQENGDLLRWFATQDFTVTVILLIFLSFASKFLKGGKLNVPKQPSSKKKTSFNIPDTYGVKGKGIGMSGDKTKELNMPNYFGQKPNQGQSRELNIPNYFGQSQPVRYPKGNSRQHLTYKPPIKPKRGSWKCPKCGAIVVGNQCQRCGQWRQ